MGALTRGVLVALTAGALAVVVLARIGPQPAPYAIERAAFASDTTRRFALDPAQPPVTVARVELDTSCPALSAEWSSTNVEPTHAGSAARVELVLDGVVVAVARIGGGAGVFEDGPARLPWSGERPPGRHVVEVRLAGERAPGEWGLPYTNAPYVGLDTLLVWESPSAAAEPGGC